VTVAYRFASGSQTLARKLAAGAELSNVELPTLISESLEGLARRR